MQKLQLPYFLNQKRGNFSIALGFSFMERFRQLCRGPSWWCLGCPGPLGAAGALRGGANLGQSLRIEGQDGNEVVSWWFHGDSTNSNGDSMVLSGDGWNGDGVMGGMVTMAGWDGPFWKH